MSYVEITERDGVWTDKCVGRTIYSRGDVISADPAIRPRLRPLMTAQLIIDLAGGVGEALSRGELIEPLWFATRHCGTSTDRQRAVAVLTDLLHLTGHHFEKRDFVERTRELLLQHWQHVEALATELIAHGRIEGDRVEWIVDHAAR